MTPRPLCYFCTRTESLRPRAWRRLTLSQEAAIRASGATPYQLSQQYGVSLRTIYRVLARRSSDYTRVEVAGYHAEFEVTEAGPRQKTEWRAA